MTISDLPAVNATLNSIATLFLIAGWVFIHNERKKSHIVCMVAALITSTIFLGCYVVYHYHVGHTSFTEQGWPRVLYFTILISHLILAIAIVPLVILTVVPALRARFDRHRKMGRWTLPIWLYVSVTGVLVYFMLYHWFPPTG